MISLILILLLNLIFFPRLCGGQKLILKLFKFKASSAILLISIAIPDICFSNVGVLDSAVKVRFQEAYLHEGETYANKIFFYDNEDNQIAHGEILSLAGAYGYVYDVSIEGMYTSVAVKVPRTAHYFSTEINKYQTQKNLLGDSAVDYSQLTVFEIELSSETEWGTFADIGSQYIVMDKFDDSLYSLRNFYSNASSSQQLIIQNELHSIYSKLRSLGDQKLTDLHAGNILWKLDGDNIRIVVSDSEISPSSSHDSAREFMSLLEEILSGC